MKTIHVVLIAIASSGTAAILVGAVVGTSFRHWFPGAFAAFYIVSVAAAVATALSIVRRRFGVAGTAAVAAMVAFAVSAALLVALTAGTVPGIPPSKSALAEALWPANPIHLLSTALGALSGIVFSIVCRGLPRSP
jgi:hypothetical protein